MRVGDNPLKYGRLIYRQPEIVAGVITHLPNLEGYHKERLEIVKICLTTLRENAGKQIPVMVWDNGSGPELREWLVEEYRPDYLTLSWNVGKAAARAAIVRAFPPGTVVCMSDDDMYFHPGWLSAQLELLEHFPNVGVVTGYPVRTMFRWGNAATIAWAEKNATVRRGKLIPEAWDQDFCTSIGRDYMYHLNYTKDDVDVLIEWEGVQAYATAHHCQFICYAGRLAEIVMMYGRGWAMSDERIFDRNIDAAGLLRLATVERYTQHMGNVVEERFKLAISGASPAAQARQEPELGLGE